MVRQSWMNGLRGCLGLVLVVAVSGPVLAGEGTGRAAWLLERGAVADYALTGQRFEQSEIGGGGSQSLEVPGVEPEGIGMSGALPVLMSLVLPGAGEVAMGYKRGYFMAAADIFAWTQVAKYHSDGADLRDAYYDFADAHYTDALLVDGYSTSHSTSEGFYRDGQGDLYFPSSERGPIESIDDLGNLPLYVTKEADRREYYENLGKWDQFVFGWDDYIRPDDYPGYDPTGTRDPDLLQPWVSKNREIYRVMRDDSNQAYKSRDRWLYANIGLRLFSVFQVAYLQGMLGGGPANNDIEISGHKVEIQALPSGMYSGSLSARVSF